MSDDQLCTQGAHVLSSGLWAAAGLLVVGLAGFGLLALWLVLDGRKGARSGEGGPDDGPQAHPPTVTAVWCSKDAAWVVPSHAAVSKLPLHPAFSEDYMPAMLEKLSPEAQAR
jgi:hypothetical protein